MRDPLRTARWSLALRFAALVTFLLAGGSVGVFVYVRHALLTSFDATHDLAIRSLRETLVQRGPVLSVKNPEFHEEFDELSATLGVVSASLWEADRELAHASMLPERFPPRGLAREVRGEREHTLVIRREQVGASGAVLVVARRAGDLELSLTSLGRGLLLLGPAGLLGALALGWAMSRQALRPVQHAFDQQRAFMADASHELRTPLAVIRAQAEVQLDAESDLVGMRAALGQIARTAADLSRFVDDLLFLARTDAAALPPRRLVVALDELVEEALETFEPLAHTRGSTLRFIAPPASAEVEGDPAQLQRLLVILVDNALGHATPGPIEVRVERVGSTVRLRVDDTGPGISPELQARVFERFTRGATTHAGHGLGLAIARSIAQANRGDIALERSPLGGTAAVVSLPAHER